MSKQDIVIADIVKKYENPIAELVRVACQFGSTVMLTDEKHRVNAKSIMGIMAFAPQAGKAVGVEADGADAAEAVEAMVKFLLCE